MTAQICPQFFGGLRYSPPLSFIAGCVANLDNEPQVSLSSFIAGSVAHLDNEPLFPLQAL